MDKHTIKERDLAFEEVKKRRETVSLAQLSQKLVSVYELAKMWLSLKDGECLILSADGSIHKGMRVNARLDKMQKLQEAYKTERHIDLLRVESDMKSAEEMYPMHLTGYHRAGQWDTRVRLAGAKSGSKRTKKAAQPVLPADNI